MTTLEDMSGGEAGMLDWATTARAAGADRRGKLLPNLRIAAEARNVIAQRLGKLDLEFLASSFFAAARNKHTIWLPPHTSA